MCGVFADSVPAQGSKPDIHKVSKHIVFSEAQKYTGAREKMKILYAIYFRKSPSRTLAYDFVS